MKKLFLFSAVLVLFIWGGTSGSAKEILINDSFELGNFNYWTSFGTPDFQFIQFYDVENGFGGPDPSSCFAQMISGGKGGNDGGVRQDVYVEAGVTYVIKADICYHNC
jgi:hypothetical protein